jgi:hypothetical protein
VRQEVNINTVYYQFVLVDDVIGLVCLWFKSVQLSISEHQIAPVALEETHHILGLYFVCEDWTKEDALFLGREN